MSRIVVLIDGEHYPPVVRSAIAALSAEYEVAAAVFAGGTEKVGEGAAAGYGVPLVREASAAEGLRTAVARYCPEAVVDLSDEPVVSSEERFRLASVALELGVEYRGADFRFAPPRRPLATTTPALAVVGTGKRVGKTAVSAHIARALTADGRSVAIVAMGRGGPETPELVRGDLIALTTADLLEAARSGAHAASDSYEDAVMARVATVGCRRCGGGMAGSVFFSNVADGARMADGLGKDLLLLEGSGSAVPPLKTDATVLVIGASQGPGYVRDYFGPLRVREAELVVLSGAEEPIAPLAQVDAMAAAVRDVSPGVPIVRVTFRPQPIAPVAGARVFFATTAPGAMLPLLTAHLEREHGCTVAAASAHLSDRAALRADMDAAAGSFDVLVTELKAAAVDVICEAGDLAGVPVVLADNVPVAARGDDLASAIRDAAALALARGHARSGDEA